jgi:hypothetical protein
LIPGLNGATQSLLDSPRSGYLAEEIQRLSGNTGMSQGLGGLVELQMTVIPTEASESGDDGLSVGFIGGRKQLTQLVHGHCFANKKEGSLQLLWVAGQAVQQGLFGPDQVSK